MNTTLLTPEEISPHLGMGVSTLQKYVTYFPSLFTGYAKDEHKHRYTMHDVKIFSRITQLGDRISITCPEPASSIEGEDAEERERQKAILSEDLASILINVSRNVDLMRETLESLVMKVDASSPEGSREAINSLQEQLNERLNRIEMEMGLDRQTAMEYRRSLSGLRWHWRDDCPHFPRIAEHFKPSTRPFGFGLCTICLSKTEKTQPLVGNNPYSMADEFSWIDSDSSCSCDGCCSDSSVCVPLTLIDQVHPQA